MIVKTVLVSQTSIDNIIHMMFKNAKRLISKKIDKLTIQDIAYSMCATAERTGAHIDEIMISLDFAREALFEGKLKDETGLLDVSMERLQKHLSIKYNCPKVPDIQKTWTRDNDGNLIEG